MKPCSLLSEVKAARHLGMVGFSITYPRPLRKGRENDRSEEVGSSLSSKNADVAWAHDDLAHPASAFQLRFCFVAL